MKPGDRVFIRTGNDGGHYGTVVEVRAESVVVRCDCGHPGEYTKRAVHPVADGNGVDVPPKT